MNDENGDSGVCQSPSPVTRRSGVRRGPYFCSLRPRHGGNHIARDAMGDVIAEWTDAGDIESLRIDREDADD